MITVKAGFWSEPKGRAPSTVIALRLHSQTGTTGEVVSATKWTVSQPEAG